MARRLDGKGFLIVGAENLYYYSVESCFPAKGFATTQGIEETEVLLENGISRVT